MLLPNLVLPLGAVVLLLLLLGISGRLLIRRDLPGSDAIDDVSDGALVNGENVVVKVGNMLDDNGEDQVAGDEEDGDKRVLAVTAAEETDGAKVKVKGGAALFTS